MSASDAGPPRITPALTIGLLPITAGLDLLSLAINLSASLQTLGLNSVVLSRGDLAGRSSQREFDEILCRAGRMHACVLLVGDQADHDWMARCCARCDETVSVADARIAPALHDRSMKDGGEPRSSARETLLLLHQSETPHPRATAQWLADRRAVRHLHVRLKDAKHAGRLARILSGRSLGVVLSGGVARGFAHIGALMALAEAGIEADVIGGASIGSIIGAWRTSEINHDELVALARGAFSFGEIDGRMSLSIEERGKWARDRLEASVERAVGFDVHIEDLWIPFFCVAMDVETKVPTTFRHGRLVDALLASFAMPGYLPAVVIGGRAHVDAAFINNLPIDVMRNYPVQRTIGIDLLPVRTRTQKRHGGADICIKPDLSSIGLLDWKSFDLAIEKGKDAAKVAIDTDRKCRSDDHGSTRP